MDPKRRYWFPIIGYNYRMTNVQAAIGLAQLEKIDWQLERRAAVAAMYKENLRGTAGLTLQSESAHATHVYWMFNVLLDGRSPDERDAMGKAGLRHALETFDLKAIAQRWDRIYRELLDQRGVELRGLDLTLD